MDGPGRVRRFETVREIRADPAETGLGKLVDLSRKERPPRPQASHSGPAEVLVFTGVRYQRENPTGPGRPTNTSDPNKRRRG
jgi:hypothetical protein